MSIAELSEQEQIRRNSLAQLRELGIDPYPAARYEVTATAAQIAAEYSPEKQNFSDISIAGRILSRRIMGSASFFEACRTIRARYRSTSSATKCAETIPKRRSTTRSSRSCST